MPGKTIRKHFNEAKNDQLKTESYFQGFLEASSICCLIRLSLLVGCRHSIYSNTVTEGWP